MLREAGFARTEAGASIESVGFMVTTERHVAFLKAQIQASGGVTDPMRRGLRLLRNVQIQTGYPKIARSRRDLAQSASWLLR
jgi:hypothetical protein